MKITLEEEDLKVSIEVPDGQQAEEVIEHFEGLMVAFTYQPESVKKAILERADEHKECDNNVSYA
jgi:hypothetical protein